MIFYKHEGILNTILIYVYETQIVKLYNIYYYT